MTDPREVRPVRIANCSGFFGDRIAAAREQVEGGPIDVLTGDWLAELTMLILVRQRLKRGPGSGYARTFLTQMEQVLDTCLERGIRVVSNAGGLDPHGCAEALAEVAAGLGLAPRIAVVTGDDLTGRTELIADAVNISTGEKLGDLGLSPVTANAYLGAFGIAAALEAGADVVITGRVTDAALAVGPAAWWHGWSADDLDPLAGAVAAAHVIECGAQACAGNYAFFAEVADMTHLGFPIAEIAADGSSVITKHPGTGGEVSRGTVTAQLLYEVDTPAYLGPDVTARFDTIELEDVGPDRVGIGGVRGDPPPDTLKVALTTLAGFRNTVGIVLTGLDLDAKATLVEQQLQPLLATFADASLDRVAFGPQREELRVTAIDPDQKKVGRAFSSAVIELTLASFAGFYPTAPPGDARPYSIYWPTLVPAGEVEQVVTVDGEEVARLSALSPQAGRPPVVPAAENEPANPPHRFGADASEDVALGRVVGARSGDKGGDANIGLWVRTDDAWPWLRDLVTARRVRAWIPEAADKRVDVYPLPSLRAVNIVVRGLLGRGVADGVGLDPQAKGLGEWVRAQSVPVPLAVLTDEGRTRVTDTVTTPLTERGRRTRDTLVTSARRVFESRGYAGTRIQDVAADAGVSHGTVYTWFPGKDELLREVTHAIVGDVVAAARERPRDVAQVEPYPRLASATRRFLVGYRRNARMLAVVEEAASADADWLGLLDELREVYVERTRRTLARLQGEGLVSRDVDPEVAAPALTGMVETFARRSAASPSTPDADVEQLTRLWARAVGMAVPPLSADVDPHAHPNPDPASSDAPTAENR